MDKCKVASYALQQAKALGADEAECAVNEKEITELYYESGKISMVRTNFNNALSLKILKDKRKGTVSLNSLDASDIDFAVRQAVENAEHAELDEAEGICDRSGRSDFRRGKTPVDLDRLYDRLAEFLACSADEYPEISFDSVIAKYIYADSVYLNTNDTELYEDECLYEFSPMYMAREGSMTSSFNASDFFFRCPDRPFMDMGMTRQLIEQTRRQVRTCAVEGKFEGPVIFTPPCLEDILGMIEDNFLSDRVLISGASPYKNRLNDKVASDILTVACRPLDQDLVCGYFSTSDGYPAENMNLIEKGVLRNFVLSRYGAAKTGLARSANDGGCYVVDAGHTPLEKMIGDIKQGLLVNRFSGGSPGVDGDFTGVAKNSFLIKDGMIADAVSETMISGNLMQLLQSVSAVSSERVNNGAYILPWVKVEGITVSGK